MEYANSHWMIWNLKSIYLYYALTLQGLITEKHRTII